MSRFSEVFRQTAAPNLVLNFAEFMQLALYHEETGYYRREHPRVGTGPGTDFYTASSVGEAFRRLVAEASRSLLRPESPAKFSFVEIGCEPGHPLFGQPEPTPFGETLTFPLPTSPQIPPAAVLFSNELFDAQPFHRIRFLDGGWRELGVEQREGEWVEAVLPSLSPEVAKVAPRLPETAAEGYTLDLPLHAVRLCREVVSGGWRGVFVAFDYGKSWLELTTETPAGTARAYFQHRQESDLLARPGEQDLTCHVCWDWLEAVLTEAGFSEVRVESQESFFVKRALPAIAAMAEANEGRSTQLKRQLAELLHPANLGQKFQVLSGRRM